MSVYQMLQNLQSSFPGIQLLITGASYIIGVCLIVGALYNLHHVADQRNMMSQQHSISGPLLGIIVGSVLLYLPSMLTTMTITLWGTSSPLGYAVATTSQYGQMVSVVMQIVKIVGIIAFIRGWLIIAKSADSGQQGGVGKGLTHIIGGLLAFHMDATLQVLQNTFLGSS